MSSPHLDHNRVSGAFFGVAVGDALGVPYEFSSRDEMAARPATTNLTGYGAHDQPPGTWSDDAALTFCLAESLVGGYDLADIAKKFVRWKEEAYWSARGEVFDIGLTTARAIDRLHRILVDESTDELRIQRYLGTERENGNGSLMRILPLLFHIHGRPIAEQFERIWEVSALTHRHIRAAMCCLIYLRVGGHLLEGRSRPEAYAEMRGEITRFWDEMALADWERSQFTRLIQNDIRDVGIDSIRTGGYVLESIESALFFLLRENDFPSTLLSIINLGHDTDTSAAIVGGLAGLHYGLDAIPEDWRYGLARMEDIVDLTERFAATAPVFS